MKPPSHEQILGLSEQAQEMTVGMIHATPSGNKRNLYTEANMLLMSAIAKLNDAKKAR